MSLHQHTKNFDRMIFDCICGSDKETSYFGPTLALSPPDESINQNFLKNKINAQRNYDFTSVYQKLSSHDSWSNRCGLGQMDGRKDEGMEGRTKEVKYRGR